MTITASFTTIPKSRVAGGTVRFFPVLTGATAPFTIYSWDFGDGNTSTDPSPKHDYSGATTYTFTVSFHAHDSYGTASTTATGTVPIALASAVSTADLTTYDAISVFLYNDTSSVMINRTANTSSMYLMVPLIKNTIDFSTTTEFSVLVPTGATAAERAFLSEGGDSPTNVIVLQGNSIAFSGVVRRCTQNLQGTYSATTPIQMWDFECDNDLYKLSKLNVNSTALNTSGAFIIDSPGYIAREILTPLGTWDWRGDIMCTDAYVTYQINPSTVVDQVSSQYEQLMALQKLTNYDLRTRMDYDVYTCAAFNGTTTVTVTGLSATPSLVGYYLFFPSTADGCETYGKITANSADTIVSSGLIVGSSATPAWVIVAKQPKIDFAPNLSTISNVATFGVNDTLFEYSDNDDKRKLYTKVIAKGKDLQGKNISVALSGVHAYDYDTQFFKDSTFITKKSEGYVYANSYVNSIYSCTAIVPRSSIAVTKTNLSTDTTGITLPSSQAGFLVNQEVTFTAPPRPLVAGTPYFISDHTGDVIKVSATQGGANITLLENLRTYAAQWSIASTASAAGVVTVTIKGTVAAVVSISNGELDHITAVKVSNALNGYVDTSGCTWVVTSDGTYPYMNFSTTDSAYAGTMIAYDMGTTGQTATEESSSTPAITCTASTPSQMQASNSNGLLQKGTAIVFKATTIPTGLTAGTVYTVKNDGVNLSGFCFCVMSGGTQMSWTDVGDTVKLYRTSDVINRNSSGTSSVWLYGRDFAIDTTLTYSLISPYGNYENVTLSDTGTVQVASDGTIITQFLLLESTLPASSDSDYGGRGYFMSSRFYVQSNSLVSSTVLVGEEPLTIASTGNSPAYGNYINIGAASGRVTSDTKKCYPHDVGSLVARTNYTEATPETYSVVADYGLHINTLTVETNTTYGQLDAYATALLLGFGAFYKKATCWLPIQYALVKRAGETSLSPNITTMPKIGDMIGVIETIGATPVDYQIVAETIKYDESKIELQLGDYEKNIFLSIQKQTSGLNQTLT